MSFSDYRMCVGWMQERLTEAERSAANTRLRKQYGRPTRGWLAKGACQTLCGLGRVMVATGQWLQRYSMPHAVRLERNSG
jgi:hypothetical protein